MDNRFLKKYILLTLLLLITGAVVLYKLIPGSRYRQPPALQASWFAPDLDGLPQDEAGDLVRYGHELIVHTAKYLGPQGSVAHISNGMNCGNCHLNGGTRLNGNCFAMAASSYPKYRGRSGQVETIAYRVNDCLQRSLNGNAIDTSGKEMKALIAYIKWIGKDVTAKAKPAGMGIPGIPFLERAASPENGRTIYAARCSSCHGADGEGVRNGTNGYLYPPLYGSNSFNVSSGIYLLSRMAGFVKYNMPYTAQQSDPTLTDAEAWDVAAFINTQSRPAKRFAQDWPKITEKPVDYPFGPYADHFPEQQHKLGPFEPIIRSKQK